MLNQLPEGPVAKREKLMQPLKTSHPSTHASSSPYKNKTPNNVQKGASNGATYLFLSFIFQSCTFNIFKLFPRSNVEANPSIYQYII